MYQNHSIIGTERHTGQHPANTRRHLVDIWDLLAVIVVVVLVVHLWPFDEAGPGHRNEQGYSMESRPQADQIIKDPVKKEKSVTFQENGFVSGGGLSSIPEDGYDDSFGANVIEKIIVQLALFQQREGWTLLPGDVADALRALDRLVAQGVIAIPAIRGYLRDSTDSSAAGGGFEQTGYASLRLALFDVLRQIGGKQAEAIWYEELRATDNPVEIEALGRYLEEQAPGLYRRDVVTAARDAFDVATDDGVHGLDIGPLFQVFKDYGDESLVDDLSQVSQLRWGQYAAVTLAGLPGGVGISSLTRWVEGASPRNASAAFALKILAQSADYPEAQVALLNGLRDGQISEAHWPEFAKLLAGTYRIQLEPPSRGYTSWGQEIDNVQAPVLRSRTYSSRTPGGGQVLYGVESAAPVLLPEQAESRMELIEALLGETQSPIARRELERAFETIWAFYRDQERMRY
ncbi:hypothetical protein [Marinobacterium rhizophilum]|uniref:Uncharacterized protein n=1 Tax=Marinobacterium rhizophilum TaxID=420402 RepID=A0ABY5HJR6_9GAMM|nr:hypothetical protein [Marinobacterium rhizophilum]UTW12194.1 hypothetical protein KDW95_00425 [Marinobacterium rhizophilum]